MLWYEETYRFSLSVKGMGYLESSAVFSVCRDGGKSSEIPNPTSSVFPWSFRLLAPYSILCEPKWSLLFGDIVSGAAAQICMLPCPLHSLSHDLGQRSPTFLAPGTGFEKGNFSTDGARGVVDGSGGNASDGDWWRTADEASLTRSLLTSCCAARFLTGRGPVPVCSPRVGDPCCRESLCLECFFKTATAMGGGCLLCDLLLYYLFSNSSLFASGHSWCHDVTPVGYPWQGCTA